MSVRLVKSKEEIRRIVPVFIQVFGAAPYNERWSPQQAYKRLAWLYSNGRNFCFYILESDQVVGFIFCRTMVWPEGNRVFVEDMGVLPNYRRRGIARKLVNALEKQAKIHGIHAIELEIMDHSPGSRFWPKFGYRYAKRLIFSKNFGRQ